MTIRFEIHSELKDIEKVIDYMQEHCDTACLLWEEGSGIIDVLIPDDSCTMKTECDGW